MLQRDMLYSSKQARQDATIYDTYWILAYALLDSFTDDLATAKLMGLWDQNPKEIMQHKIITMDEKCPTGTTSWNLYSEYRSQAIQDLMMIVTEQTRGAVQMDSSTLIRDANHKARKKPLLSANRIASIHPR